jgi:predicted small secreted protein
MLDRRALLISGLAVATAALASCQTTPPLGAGVPISAVHVDVSRLVELGIGPYAATIKAIIERDLTSAFAPDRRRGGATVTVAVRSLHLSAYIGGDFDDGEGRDHLDSVTTVTGADGRVFATYPVNASNGSGDAGPWYDPNLIDKRINRLATNHALWIKRMVLG